MKLNSKYTTVIGAILIIIGITYSLTTKTLDVIIVFFFVLLGAILFLIGIVGLLGDCLKRRKEKNKNI